MTIQQHLILAVAVTVASLLGLGMSEGDAAANQLIAGFGRRSAASRPEPDGRPRPRDGRRGPWIARPT